MVGRGKGTGKQKISDKEIMSTVVYAVAFSTKYFLFFSLNMLIFTPTLIFSGLDTQK